jgi:hypothetical protein
MKQVMIDFNDIMRDGSYNDEVRAMYNDLQHKYKYLTTFKNQDDGFEKYAEVALVTPIKIEHQITIRNEETKFTDEIIGRDSYTNEMKYEEIDKVES